MDLIAVTKMHRTYTDGTGAGEKDGGVGNAYFHLRMDCIKKRVPGFKPTELIFLDSVSSEFGLTHQRHIQTAMRYNFCFSG